MCRTVHTCSHTGAAGGPLQRAQVVLTDLLGKHKLLLGTLVFVGTPPEPWGCAQRVGSALVVAGAAQEGQQSVAKGLPVVGERDSLNI